MKKSIWHESYEVLYSQLRQARKDAGLTQRQLSEILNKPQSYVSKYETGERNLDFIEVLQICDACGFAVENLIQKLIDHKTNQI